MKHKIKIIKANFTNPDHCKAEIDLLKAYMKDNMGGTKPLSEKQNKDLINGLKNQLNLITLLAIYDNKYAGLTNSFLNFSTFTAKPFLNIHDVIVLKEYRGLGIGKRLMDENIRLAESEFNCSKITLEVRDDNVVAQELYKSLKFKDTSPPMLFWTRKL